VRRGFETGAILSGNNANLQQELKAFKDPALAKGLVESIAKLVPEGGANLMEVCGTHTVTIARNGIKGLMPEGVRLLSGPGCPVCVTSNHDIDKVIALARVPEVTIATFGDMTRVPGSTSSLLAEQAAGRSVEIVYSPLDALRLASENPQRQIVFVGVGFETTTPLVAMAIKRAKAAGLTNFSVYGAHKNMPGALETIVANPDLKLDALILPGHVSTIIGVEPYRFLAEKYGIPGVITGFEPNDVLQGIAMIMRQLHEGRAEIEIAYARGVMPEGNPVAMAAIDEVFETCNATWRGLGEIAGSGYKIREEFAQFDAMRKFEPEVEAPVEPKGCRCGDVLRGIMPPSECPLFRRVCTPENPVGPCMVSSEGSCAAYFRYY
jgi:hydrogenase expression/formation protein HypD